MSCGLPVIGSTAGAIPEVVREGTDGLLVEPGNVQQIKEAILQLAGDDQRRKEMAKAARRRVEQDFTWNRIADQYEELYDHAVSNS